jgi:hypothetical protein
MTSGWRRLLETRAVVLAPVIAIALTLPSLGNGLEIDDHLYRARVLEGWSAARSAEDLFLFSDPDAPHQILSAMDAGELSWWAAPNLRWRCMRPLPQLVLHAEFSLLGRGGVGWMHLHSILWMGLLAVSVAGLYRRLLGRTWMAGLAAILYAIDDGHGFTVGWVANRCVIMATVAAVAALAAHDRWRRDGWRAGALLGPLAFAFALACDEEAVAAAGLLIAHAAVLDSAGWRARVAAVAPYAAIIVVWYAIRIALGYGIYGTGSYTDPIAEPIAFATQAIERIPIYIHSQLGALPADLWEVYFVRHGLSWLMAAIGAVFALAIAFGFARLVRRDPVCRFWALGGTLALVAVCGAHPTDRHMLLVGVAGAALVARYVGAWLERAQPASRALLPVRGAGVLAVFLIAVHLVFAPIALPIRARLPGALSRGVAKIDTLVPGDAALAGQDLVLVNVPFKYLCNFASVVRRSEGGLSPRHWYCLGVSSDDVIATRPDARTLVLRPAQGYLHHFEDTNVRSRRFPFQAGDRVELADVSITVLEVTDDGRPAEVAFAFAMPLEDVALRLVVWRDRAYQLFVPPPVGSSVTIPAQRFAFGELMEDR